MFFFFSSLASVVTLLFSSSSCSTACRLPNALQTHTQQPISLCASFFLFLRYVYSICLPPFPHALTKRGEQKKKNEQKHFISFYSSNQLLHFSIQ